MNLIVKDRTRTYAAGLQGEEWTDADPLETSLDPLCSWISRVRAGADEDRTPSIREDGDVVVIDFTNEIGIVGSQLVIDCNASDRDELIRKLTSVCEDA